MILCSEEASHSPLLSDSGEGRLQRSGTWYLEAVIMSFVMGGGVVILSQVRDNGSCSGCVFQANNPHFKCI